MYILKYHRHHLLELAEYITAGFLTGFICQLLFAKGWENQKPFLLPSSAIKRIRGIYANFLLQGATKRLDERSFVYGRKIERDFRERIKEHCQDTKEAKTKGKDSHHRMFCVREDFTDDEFFILAVYGKDTHPAINELPEGFTIIALGPYESRPFLDLTSQLQLPVVADSYDRRLGLGAKSRSWNDAIGDFSTTP
ncbi:uncharacterized protein K444DRAFT_623889 [Hyaloscypha bicolor E]|uniref:Uncharacterized protein n=1 Tax=Hyaloscypha bicolor E TaxID=1095630 RepID=A0A2J6TTP9_9HELO|nr:uncharacterized protein K444DRAFT_623889 [Hyaloscypha bicolor E]PMD66376.1 hypothetical protein K444DRAFT_623889 [Hyaloscypha bicolor E]